MKIDYWSSLVPGHCYHIYSRANHSGQLLFRDSLEMEMFLSKWSRYSHGLFDTFAYCLTPSEFHLVVFIKQVEDPQRELIFKRKTKKGRAFLLGLCSSNDFYASIFQQLFVSFVLGVNAKNNERGSRFQAKFKRELLPYKNAIREKIQELHGLPIEAGLCAEYIEWSYSSFKEIVEGSQRRVSKQAVFELYNSIEKYTCGYESFLKEHQKRSNT